MAGVQLANAWVNIVPETKDIAPQVKKAFGQVEKVAQKAGQNMGQAMDNGFGAKVKSTVGKLGGLAAGIAGVSGAAQVMQNGFRKVTAIEDTTQALSVLMGSADEASAFMDKLTESNEKSTYSFDAWADAGKTLVAFGVDADQANETVTALGEAAATTGEGADALGRMARELGQASAQGKITGETLNTLSDGGVRGLEILANHFDVTTEEMQKMVSNGTVPAEEGIKALTDGIINGSDGAAGHIEAMSGVMGEMANTTSGHLTNMISQFNNVAAAVIEKVSPAIGLAAGWLEEHAASLAQWIQNVDVSKLRDDLAPTMETMGDTAERLQPSLESLGDSFVTISQNITVSTWKALAGVLNGLAPIVENVLTPMLEKVAEFAENNPKKVEAIVWAFLGFKALGAITGPVGKAFGALRKLSGATRAVGSAAKTGGAVAGIKEIGAQAGKMSPKLGKLGGNLKKFGSGIGKAFGKLTPLLSTVSGAFGKLGGAIARALGAARPFLSVLGKGFLRILPGVGIILTIVDALSLFFRKTEIGQQIWQGLVDAVSAGWDWILEKFQSAMGWIQTNVGPVIQGIWDKLTGFFTWFGGVVTNVFGGVLAVAIGTAIGLWNMLSSTITALWDNVLMPFFNWFGQSMTALWQNVISPVITWIIEKWNTLSGALQVAWQVIKTSVIDVFQQAMQWLRDRVSAAIEAIKSVWNGLVTALQAVWNWIKSTVIDPFANAMQWLWNNAVRPVIDWIVAGWNRMRDALNVAWQFIQNSILTPLGNAFMTLWNVFVQPVVDWISSKWDWLSSQMQAGWQWINNNVFTPFKNGLTQLKSFFGTVVDGIRSVWNGLKAALAKPINFMINTVYNNGIAKAWDTIGGFLPLEPKTAKRLSPIGGYATGGAIRGEGTGTSDDILAWLSNGEHVWTAQDVRNIGGQSAMYAMRDALKHGRGFTFDGENLALLPHVDSRVGDLEGAAPGLFPQGAFKGGGEVRPMWELQLEKGHRWAKSRHGRPYVLGGSADGGGGTDCSGFMSGIADVMGGGSGARQWATMAFNGGGNQQYPSGPQGFVAGLKGNTFSIGVTNGGAAGGHTAGTLGATSRVGAVNVESGGSPSMVKYGTGAVGANDGYFRTHYHLPIGPGGAFQIGKGTGGPSPEQMRESILEKALGFAKKIFNPIKSLLPSGPPSWKDIPKGVFEKGTTAFPKAIKAAVGNLRDNLSTVFSAIGEIGSRALDGGRDIMAAAGRAIGLHDSGGWLQDGNLALNMSGKPEPVLTNAQWASVSEMVKSIGDLVPAVQAQTDALSKQVAATEAFLSKAANPYTLEGISSRSFAGEMGEIAGLLGLENSATVTKTLLDAEESLLKSREEHAERLATIREKEDALAEARRELAELSAGGPQASEQAAKQVADAEAEIAKAREDGDAARIAKAEKNLAEARSGAEKSQAEAATQHADDVAKARDKVTQAEKDLVSAREASARALDMTIHSINPDIYNGLNAAANQVASQIPQVADALRNVAFMFGPQGITVGMVIEGAKVAINVFKMTVQVIKNITGKIINVFKMTVKVIKNIIGKIKEFLKNIEDVIFRTIDARIEAVKAAGDAVGVVADLSKMLAEQRETVAGLRQDAALATLELRAAFRNVRIAQMDGVKAQLEAQKTVAEAQAEFEAQRRSDMRLAAAQYEDLSLAYDRFRWSEKKSLDAAMNDVSQWSDETRALYQDLQAAQIDQLLAEKEAQRASLEAVYEHTLAAMDLQDVTRDLGSATKQLALISGKSFGMDTPSAIIGERIADLYAEQAELKSQQGQNWWKVFSWHASGASTAAAKRTRQIDSEIARLEARPEWQGFNQQQQDTINKALNSAGWMGFAGGGDYLQTMLRASALGDPQRAMDELKLNQELANLEADQANLRSKIERGILEVENRAKIDPLETEITGLEMRRGSKEAWAEYWRSDNAGVRDALAALAQHQAESADELQHMAQNDTEIVFQFPGGKSAISIDEFRQYAEQINRDNRGIKMRVDALENPRPSAALVSMARR